MKVNCAYCGNELERRPCRAKGRNYCNGECQMNYEYANGIRDKFSITQKANEKVRQFGLPNRRGKPTWSKGLNKRTHPSIKKQAEQMIGNKNPMFGKVGSLSPQFKHGLTILYKRAWSRSEYRQWREAVYERDSYTCQLCGDDKGGNLNAHHIKSFKDFPELRYDTNNGITLCQTCHREVHRKVSFILIPILIE